jgi:hypothetical protein
MSELIIEGNAFVSPQKLWDKIHLRYDIGEELCFGEPTGAKIWLAKDRHTMVCFCLRFCCSLPASQILRVLICAR